MSSTNVCFVNIPTWSKPPRVAHQNVFPSQFVLPGVVCSWWRPHAVALSHLEHGAALLGQRRGKRRNAGEANISTPIPSKWLMQLQLYNAAVECSLVGYLLLVGAHLKLDITDWEGGWWLMAPITMQAGVSRTSGGCERCKDEWKQESYGRRLRYSCRSLVCVSPWP